MDEQTIKLLRLLLARLERISADSYWAHQASGVRGSLLRIMDNFEQGLPVPESAFEKAVENGFFILGMAVRERAQ